jgi:hypothetical protein
MVIVDGPDLESAVLHWTREWFELLAKGQLEAACARLDEPNSYGTVWTPDAIVELVSDTFSSGTIFSDEHPEGPQFSSPRTATGRERWSFVTFADGSGGELDYDVPLNGKFSDLTAQFEFYWRAPRTLAVRLHDLHVM